MRLLLVLILSAPIWGMASQDFKNCEDHFFNDKPPSFIGSNRPAYRYLCFDEFAVLYSPYGKTPIYSAQKLNYKEIANSYNVNRDDQFQEDARLRWAERSTLKDYRGSGYDRGHLTPSADMQSKTAMYQSFLLTNIIPQNSYMNQKPWRKVESSVRKYIRKRTAGDVYIVTGVLFDSGYAKIGNGVAVPSRLYKAVFDANKFRGWVFLMDNTRHAKINKPIELVDFYKQTGIDVFNLYGHKHE